MLNYIWNAVGRGYKEELIKQLQRLGGGSRPLKDASVKWNELGGLQEAKGRCIIGCQLSWLHHALGGGVGSFSCETNHSCGKSSQQKTGFENSPW